MERAPWKNRGDAPKIEAVLIHINENRPKESLLKIFSKIF